MMLDTGTETGLSRMQISAFAVENQIQIEIKSKWIASPRLIKNIMKASFKTPPAEAVVELGQAIGLPLRECEKFYAYFDSIGWVIGRDRKPMKSLRGAMATWKLNWQDKQEQGGKASPSVRAMLLRDELKVVNDSITYLMGQRPLSPKLAQKFTDAKNERQRIHVELRRLM